MSYLPLPHSPDLPPYASRAPRRRWGVPGVGRIGGAGIFLATAAVSGVLFHLFVFTVFSPFARQPSIDEIRLRPLLDPESPYYVHPDAPLRLHTKIAETEPAPIPTTTPLLSGGEKSRPKPYLDTSELSVEEVQELVSRTNGYFTREYSLGLGWNNMRYIIEAALLQSQILNRTLVLPSFVYARGCEYNITVCADYAPMVNKGDAIGWDEWRELPIEQQMGWRIPMELMLNLTHLRQSYPVILTSDYMRLHGLDPTTEYSNGMWNRWDYHQRPSVLDPDQTRLPTLSVIENLWYDPSGTIRVDFLPEDLKARGNWNTTPGDTNVGQFGGHWPLESPTKVFTALQESLGENQFVLGWDQARRVVETTEPSLVSELADDKTMEDYLNANGWEVLYTFRGVIGMDYTKTVTDPMRQVAARSSLRGFKDDFFHLNETVVVLGGETHLGRKPGALRFTTPAARSKFATMVVHALIAISRVLDLGAALSERMQKLTGGRLWMGAHMRRGDFIRLGWAMEAKPLDHVNRVKGHLGAGREILIALKNITTYPIEGVEPDYSQLTTPPPIPTDPFYIATDERDPEAIRIIGEGGAIFMWDLLNMEDRQQFGWPLMIMDIRALVEQALLAHSAFFYGHGMSSVAGGIVNLRAVRGADPRTLLLD